MDHIIIAKPCTVQDWAKAMKVGTDNTNHHLAIDALALLLDDKVSASNAAAETTAAYENSIKAISSPTNFNNEVSSFYARYMCDAIRTFDGASKRLVDLLVAISERPDITSADGSSTSQLDGSVYWRDLPSWSYNFLEYGIRESSSKPICAYT
jgi:hypothetical protein